jgi:hypothetical protein
VHVPSILFPTIPEIDIRVPSITVPATPPIDVTVPVAPRRGPRSRTIII